MLTLLRDYSFLTVALGTVFLALAASCVGTITVLTKQSLVGDMVGHASYPGVVFAFMVFQSRQPILLMLGAMLSGYLSYGLVYWVSHHYRQSLTNGLALVSAGFFGLGMVLKQFVQGNAHFVNASQAGLQTYLFGQAAFIQKDDVVLIMVMAAVCLMLFVVHYQQFRLYLFDPVFAQTQGVRIGWLKQLTILMMVGLIAVGLKVVGAILMSSFLIAPAVFGLLLGKSYPRALLWSAALGMGAAFVGTYVSSLVSGLSTGPSIIVAMTGLTLAVYGIQILLKGGRSHG